ncbi:MAG: hypothetical protein EOP48_13760 [Sphingobacteriales bacterium]|nr:MAG: hypothetical protein EOP48_13760 [Sphingobacteriales bacterium]
MKRKILTLLLTVAITNVTAQSLKNKVPSEDSPYSVNLEFLEKSQSPGTPTKLSLDIYEFFSSFGIKANHSTVYHDVSKANIDKSFTIPSAVSFLQIRYGLFIRSAFIIITS